MVAVLFGLLLVARPGFCQGAADEIAVRAATEAYSRAWLADDPVSVMRTLVSDPVLLPSGRPPLVGAEAVRAFWWPPSGPTTRVIAMRQEIDAVGISGDLAYSRGRGTLTYVLEPPTRSAAGPPTTIHSTFINILRRQPNGSWLIAERMWSDLRVD